VSLFDRLAESGVREAGAGDRGAAAELFRRAISLYHGDLSGGTDAYTVIERERLRAAYLTLLAHLADYHYSKGDIASCLLSGFILRSGKPKPAAGGHRVHTNAATFPTRVIVPFKRAIRRVFPRRHDKWSIGIYGGISPFEFWLTVHRCESSKSPSSR
jgi:hypothetical protein